MCNLLEEHYLDDRDGAGLKPESVVMSFRLRLCLKCFSWLLMIIDMELQVKTVDHIVDHCYRQLAVLECAFEPHLLHP